MTARQMIMAKPATVRVVVGAMVTKAAINDPVPDFEQYSAVALDDWQSFVSDYRGVHGPISEAALAGKVVERLRQDAVWGKILRGDAQ